MIALISIIYCYICFVVFGMIVTMDTAVSTLNNVCLTFF
jgi:hypothetical protein